MSVIELKTAIDGENHMLTMNFTKSFVIAFKQGMRVPK